MIRNRICIKHNETIGVRHQRLLAFGPLLTSVLTLISPAFGRPDLASELPLVPRVVWTGCGRVFTGSRISLKKGAGFDCFWEAGFAKIGHRMQDFHEKGAGTTYDIDGHILPPMWVNQFDQILKLAVTKEARFLTVGTRGHSRPTLHSLRSLRAVRSFCQPWAVRLDGERVGLWHRVLLHETLPQNTSLLTTELFSTALGAKP